MRHAKHKGPAGGNSNKVPTTTEVPPPHKWKVSSSSDTFRTFGTLTGASIGGFEGALIGGTLGSLLDD